MGGIFPESTLRVSGRHRGSFARHKHETLESERLRLAFWKTALRYSWRLMGVEQIRFFQNKVRNLLKEDIFVEGNADTGRKKTAADFPPVKETMSALDQTFGVCVD